MWVVIRTTSQGGGAFTQEGAVLSASLADDKLTGTMTLPCQNSTIPQGGAELANPRSEGRHAIRAQALEAGCGRPAAAVFGARFGDRARRGVRAARFG
jgi:hypothetical protein